MPLDFTNSASLSPWGGLSPLATGNSAAGSTFRPYDSNAMQSSLSYYNQMLQQRAFDRQMAEQHWAHQLAADTQTRLAQMQLAERQRQFNKSFGFLKGQLPLAANFGGGPVGGPQPTITAGPIWDENQVQSRVNAMRGQTDQSVATRQRDLQDSLTARGFASSSPLISALQGQAFAAGLGSSTAAENDLRWNAARDNADHLLRSQVAQESQYSNRQQENIGRRGISAGVYSTLLSALGGLGR